MISLRSIITFILISLILLSAACIKESKPEIAEISVYSPLSGTYYQVLDTIYIQATIQDLHNLKSVEISLNDEYNRPVLPLLSYNNPSNPFYLNLEYPIGDSSIESGSYTIQIKADNGSTITYAFREVNIIGFDKEFSYPIILTQHLTNQYSFQMLTDSDAVTNLYTWQGDYSASAVNSSKHLLYVAGRSQSDLVAYDLMEKKVKWSIPAKQKPHGRWFETICFQNALLYVSFYEEGIKAIDSEGTTEFTVTVSKEYSPGICTSVGEYLCVVLNEKNSHKSSIGVYYVPGGLLRRTIGPLPNPLSLIMTNEKHLLAFVNNGPNGAIYGLEVESGNFVTYKEILSDSITSVASMDNDNYLIASNSAVYWYRYSLNSLVEFIPHVDNPKVACESVNKVVYITTGKSVVAYTFPDGKVLNDWKLSQPVVDILLLYNK